MNDLLIIDMLPTYGLLFYLLTRYSSSWDAVVCAGGPRIVACCVLP